MADEKPITKSELLAVLKETGFATKQDVGEIVKQEISALDLVSKSDLREIVREEITEEIARYHDGQVQPDLQKIRQELELVIQSLQTQVKAGFQGVNIQFRFLKDDIEGIKADLANLPTRKQFDKLEERVTRLEGYHPRN